MRRKQELSELQASKEHYLKEIDKTKTALSDLSNNPAAIEKYAREHFQMKRDNEDVSTMKMCERIKNGVVADPDFGDDSALYEALGYIKKSNRKSGLTRKKNEPLKK